MADKGEGVKTDIFFADDRPQLFLHLLAQPGGFGNFMFQFTKTIMTQPDQPKYFGASFRADPADSCCLFNDSQIFPGSFKKFLATGEGIDELLIEKRVAPEDKEIAHKAHDQSCRASTDSLASQFLQVVPDFGAEKQVDNQFVICRGEIVRNFTINIFVHFGGVNGMKSEFILRVRVHCSGGWYRNTKDMIYNSDRITLFGAGVRTAELIYLPLQVIIASNFVGKHSPAPNLLGDGMSVFLLLSLLACGAIVVSSVTFAVGLKKMGKLDDVQVAGMVECPLISIIVPACNEEKNIEKSVLSLLAQEYKNLEIIVVNDRSTDHTSQVLINIKKRFPKLIIHEINELPAGWMGKSHALFAGAALAKGEYLVFTDADVVMEKTTIARSVAYMTLNELDHLTLIFKNMTHGLLLNSLILDSAIGLMVLFKPWLAKEKGTHWFVGIGAFNMVRHSTYKAVGGHQAIRNHPIDDMMLGRTIKEHDFAQDCLLAYNYVAVPWYDSVAAMIRGLEKNMFAVLHYRIFLVPLALLAIIIPSIWPLWGAIFGQASVQSLCLVTLVIRLATFYLGLWRQGLPGWYLPGCLITPYISCYIIVKSAFVTLKNDGIFWRGQHYPLVELRKTTPFLF